MNRKMVEWVKNVNKKMEVRVKRVHMNMIEMMKGVLVGGCEAGGGLMNVEFGWRKVQKYE